MLCCKKYNQYKRWFGGTLSIRKQRASRAGFRLSGMRIGWRRRNSNRTLKAAERSGGNRRQHSSPNRRTSLRAGLAVLGGRAAGALSRRLHLGGGTSIAGLVAQKVYPDIVGHLATQLEFGSVVVTGTNGKTTTSAFIAAILSDAGLRVWRNREGSNLMGGIASSLVMRALPNGLLRRAGQAMTIFEVDEAVVPTVRQTRFPPPAVVSHRFPAPLATSCQGRYAPARLARSGSRLPS